MPYDYVIVGAGIAGSSIAYFLKNKKVLVLDKSGICQKASGAAGAFLFPKVGYNTKYTKFINKALIESFEFYKNLGINTHKSGVVILPRDERDLSKFKEYEKSFELKYKKIENGFYFEDGGLVDSVAVCKKLLEDVEFRQVEVKNIKKTKNEFVINEHIIAKNIILATGFEDVWGIPYINIRPVWGQRISIKTDLKIDNFYHKNCSLSLNFDGIVHIGATHERRKSDKLPDDENSKILLQKANEIIKIDGEVISKKAGMRAGSIDYFPIIGKVIDAHKTLEKYPRTTKGQIPKEIFFVDGLYVINGGGGRGFSNYIFVAKMLSKMLLEGEEIDEMFDTKRLFIKWARKVDKNGLSS
jgi:glycine/D-amino acid oxidase-like deaminating enzyme